VLDICSECDYTSGVGDSLLEFTYFYMESNVMSEQEINISDFDLEATDSIVAKNKGISEREMDDDAVRKTFESVWEEYNTDPYRKKVEEAEDAIDQGRTFETDEEATKFLQEVISTDWWKQKFTPIANVKVESWEHDYAELLRDKLDVVFVMPNWNVREVPLLAAMAHMAAPAQKTSDGLKYTNGPKYTLTLLKIIRRFISKDHYESLKQKFIDLDVPFVVKKQDDEDDDS